MAQPVGDHIIQRLSASGVRTIYLAEHELSVALAERVLLPAVRRDPSVTVVADGFSCREQLRQLASVRGRHLAELLATVPTLA
jgi:hypothetical protein